VKQNLGPEHGALTLHTGRAGAASKAGHDLTLLVGAWTGSATTDEAGALTHLRLVADVGSLQVVRGDGGLKPLTDKDRGTIVEHAFATMKHAQHPEVIFETDSVQLDQGSGRLTGHVTIAGVTRPLTVEVTHSRDGETTRAQATAAITQTEFGIKPYSGMLGALRVRDLVEVRCAITVPHS
jgi:polyisoprenoid-binding protein YceI